MKKVIAVSLLVVLVCFSQTGCSEEDVIDRVTNVVQAEDENVLSVKGGEPFAYPGKTYGEAFENFFGSPAWKYFVGTKEGPDDDGDGRPDYTEENVDIVEFTGYCTYKDVEVKALIQFTLSKDDNTFEATYLSFNEVPQNNFMLLALMEAVFTDGDIDKAQADESVISQDSFDEVVESESSPSQDLDEDKLSFSDLSEYSFYFSSGAGGWGTGMEIYEDGSFEGNYHDSDMGDTGESYPNGTVYISNFSGQFSQPEKVNEYTYSMKLEKLNYDNAVGSEIIEDGVLYRYDEAFGVAGGDNFLIYLPGAPLSELPEEFKMWVGYFDDSAADVELPFYGLYNVNEQCGFSSYDKYESN